MYVRRLPPRGPVSLPLVARAFQSPCGKYIANHNGRPWTDGMIPTILANENYIGKTIYNRTSRRQ